MKRTVILLIAIVAFSAMVGTGCQTKCECREFAFYEVFNGNNPVGHQEVLRDVYDGKIRRNENCQDFNRTYYNQYKQPIKVRCEQK